jgi:hypothetical protein
MPKRSASARALAWSRLQIAASSIPGMRFQPSSRNRVNYPAPATATRRLVMN